VILRGRTDASVATSTAGELALRRALAVKGILVAQGVEPQRVRILYRAAGDFEADDSTPEGRAVNRRVEIELRRGG
jgi:outer membrane protein OmpA-like peptidoglycan-associated protein